MDHGQRENTRRHLKMEFLQQFAAQAIQRAIYLIHRCNFIICATQAVSRIEHSY